MYKERYYVYIESGTDNELQMEAISISLWAAAHPYLNYPLGRLSLSYDVFGSLGGSGGGGGSIQNPHARLLGRRIEGKAEEVVEENSYWENNCVLSDHGQQTAIDSN